MTIWEDARLETVYYDNAEAALNDSCDVRIDGNAIVVSYEGDEGPVVWKGSMKGQGHFELNSPGVNGRATLHMFENSEILEGYCDEDGYKGFWRIYL
jgi:hypothetical protein